MKLDALQPAQIHWRENNTLVSDTFDDVYYSTDGALAEIDYVFMQHNQLPQRFKNVQNFCIAETGFGSGLNFLRAAQLWLENSQAGELHFISFEKYPLEVAVLAQVHQAFCDNTLLQTISQSLLENYPYRLPGWHTLILIPNRLKMTLWFGDVLQGLPEFETLVDAWFLDGFTPSRNPEMWQTRLFTQMARLSHLQTTFATFTANGEVRRGLKAAGFEVQKDVGYGVKREMLFGQLAQHRPFAPKFPWFVRPDFAPSSQTAIVVGSGLAGATTAFQLAELGFEVTVLERHAQVAQEASSNLAGTLHPLITSDWNLRSQWYLKGYQTTQAWLKKWLENAEITGKLEGLIQLAATPTAEQRILDSLRRIGLPENFASWQTAAQLSEQLGQTVNFNGLFFPHGGWIQPSSVVKRCLQHPNIELKTQVEVTDFVWQDNQWQIQTTQDTQFSAPILVFATASLSDSLNHKLGLPVRPVKGQVTHFHTDTIKTPLRFPLTHGGYSVSLDANTHLSGATFEAPNMNTDLSWKAQAENLSTTQSALPEWIKNAPTVLKGNIAFRPTSPDHLPMIGPVADADFMKQNYLSQSHTHVVYRYPKQQYYPGLYVNNGHGARGLMSVFLAAELLGDLITQKPLNLPSALYYASHPARFAIRAWRSGQTTD